MSTPLYPELEYCLTCWRQLDPRVTKIIKRRWCSYPCARMPEPDPDPARWPRQCLTSRGYPKIKFTHPDGINSQDEVKTYECGYCGYTHIGTRIPYEAQGRR